MVDLSLRFFNTEVNVKRHLQGIVSKGWISGQSVDPHYFKMIDSSSKNKKPAAGDTPQAKFEYSQPLALHMNPAEGSRLPMEMLMTTNAKDAASVVHKKTNMQEQNQTTIADEPSPKQFYLQCKNFLFRFIWILISNLQFYCIPFFCTGSEININLLYLTWNLMKI